MPPLTPDSTVLQPSARRGGHPRGCKARRDGDGRAELLLLALLALLLAGRAARAQALAAGSAPSVGAVLNPDDTPRRDQPGAFSAKGYRLTLDPKPAAPCFAPLARATINGPTASA